MSLGENEAGTPEEQAYREQLRGVIAEAKPLVLEDARKFRTGIQYLVMAEDHRALNEDTKSPFGIIKADHGYQQQVLGYLDKNKKQFS